MKNRTQVMSQRSQNRSMEWLYQEAQEDDFLSGKTPSELQNIWEEDEE